MVIIFIYAYKSFVIIITLFPSDQKQLHTTRKVNIVGTVKLTEKEMEENEKLESFKMRIEADLIQIMRQRKFKKSCLTF